MVVWPIVVLMVSIKANNEVYTEYKELNTFEECESQKRLAILISPFPITATCTMYIE